MADSGNISHLESQIDHLRSELSSTRKDISALEGKISNIELKMDDINEAIETIDDYVKGYSEDVTNIADSLKKGNAKLNTMAERLTTESQREEQEHQRVRERLQSLQTVQSNLLKVLKDGLSQTTSQLGSLREKEESLQKLIASSANEIEKLIHELDEQLKKQMGDIEEEISNLENAEIDNIDKTRESFEHIQSGQKNLSERLSSISETSGLLVENMGIVSKHETGVETMRANQRAKVINASGLKLLASGQTVDAITRFRNAVNDAPDWMEPRFNLAVALFQAGNLSEANQVVGELLQKFSDNVNVIFLSGLLALFDAKYDDAINSFETCLKEKPQDPVFAGAMGVTHFLAGRPRDAREVLKDVTYIEKETDKIVKRMSLMSFDTTSGDT